MAESLGMPHNGSEWIWNLRLSPQRCVGRKKTGFRRLVRLFGFKLRHASGDLLLLHPSDFVLAQPISVIVAGLVAPSIISSAFAMAHVGDVFELVIHRQVELFHSHHGLALIM